MSGHKCWHHLKRAFAGVNGARLKTALIQNHGQRIGNYAFIVNNKDLRFLLYSVIGSCILN